MTHDLLAPMSAANVCVDGGCRLRAWIAVAAVKVRHRNSMPTIVTDKNCSSALVCYGVFEIVHLIPTQLKALSLAPFTVSSLKRAPLKVSNVILPASC